jgi:hypothetical protein
MAGDAPVVKQKVIKKVLLPTLTNTERNVQCLYNYALPFILLVYLGVVLKKYSLEEYKHIVPSEYLFGEWPLVSCWPSCGSVCLASMTPAQGRTVHARGTRDGFIECLWPCCCLCTSHDCQILCLYEGQADLHMSQTSSS